MKRKRNIVLGISPGTRCLGYAIMRDGELVTWGHKTYKGKWSSKKLMKILMALDKVIVHHRITSVGVKITHEKRRSMALNAVYLGIKGLCLEKRLHTSWLTIHQLTHSDKGIPIITELSRNNELIGKLDPRTLLAILVCANILKK